MATAKGREWEDPISPAFVCCLSSPAPILLEMTREGLFIPLGDRLAACDWLSMTSLSRKIGSPHAGTLLVSTRLAANSTAESLLCRKIVPWRRHFSRVSALRTKWHSLIGQQCEHFDININYRARNTTGPILRPRLWLAADDVMNGLSIRVKYARAIDSSAVDLTSARILSLITIAR